MARKTKELPHLRLRIEAPLLSKLQKSAEKNDRTLTGEIVQRLEASFNKEEKEEYAEARLQQLTAGINAITGRLNAAVAAAKDVYDAAAAQAQATAAQEKAKGGSEQ